MSMISSQADFSDTAIVVVAAGRGIRIGPGIPKQYRMLCGRPLLAIALDNLAKAAPGAALLPVIDPAALELYRSSLASISAATSASLLPPTFGGASRQDSARLGLECLSAQNAGINIVLIHDSARPFVSFTLINDAIEAARKSGAAIPGIAVADTIKLIDRQNLVEATPDRARLRAVQTPQAFRLQLVLDAHRKACAAGVGDLTDDAAVVEWAGHCVHLFAGDPDNFKVTTMDDFLRAEARLLGEHPDIRTGQGFDVHAFCAGDHVCLGGVRIPHDFALAGHSDADVLSHAVADALYGAVADGDIGAHFPPADPQWRGAPSQIFLRHAARGVRERGGLIAHVDATLICEAPKIAPHRDAIRARLAEILGVTIDRVAVKATTSERLGFTGRREGIAAMATATIRLPLRLD